MKYEVMEEDQTGDSECPIEALNIEEKNLWINLKDFSSWFKSLRVVVYVLRFLKIKLFNKFLQIRPEPSSTSFSIFRNIKENSFIDAKELKTAEYLIVKLEQQQMFTKQFKALKEGKKEKLKDQLGLYLDDDLIRCAEPYKNFQMPKEKKYPVLISHRGELARLIINEAHIRSMHMGLQTTLNEVRQRWWITKGRATVKKYT